MNSMSDHRVTSAITTAYRFVTGQHLDGIRRSDAGWISRGIWPVEGVRAGRWSLLSRAERAGIRLGGTGAAVGTLYGLQAAPEATVGTWAALGSAAALGAGYLAGNWVCDVRHHIEWIRPLHVALAGPLGLPEGTIPTAYIHIPRDYPLRSEVGRIDLPPTFVGAGGGEALIRSIVCTKLGIPDASVSFKLEGRRPYLEIRQTPRPPARVYFESPEYREIVTEMPESAPLIGIGPVDRRVSVDLDAESPHILVSASTGGGKSVITRTMASQMLHRGAQLVVLDFKRHSHKWARGLPQVHYARDIEDIHDALVALGKEGHRRNIAVDDWEGDAEPNVGPRLVILLEEANATIAKLKRWWTANRTKEDPKESPAIDALREILFMGRAVKMHVLLVAQSATAAALGGPEVRECFATRILARYTQNAWRMLVPEVYPIPRTTRKAGRAQVVLGGQATETQVLFMTDSEARDWATSGVVAEAPVLDPTPALNLEGLKRHVTHSTGPLTSADDTSVSRDMTPHLSLVKDESEPLAPRYTLAAAAREGVVPMSADALRQAKRRDPEFPAGENGRWTAEELQTWYRNRPRAVGAEA